MGIHAGDIRCCAFDFAPQGWLLCDGRSVAAAEYPQMFAAIGKAFGGDDAGNFNVPDLRSRAPLHAGKGPSGTQYTRGQEGGAPTVTLDVRQLPSHGHTSPAMTNRGTDASPEGGVYAAAGTNLYNPVGSGISGPLLGPWGGREAHNNLMPFTTVNYIIAVVNGVEGDRDRSIEGVELGTIADQPQGQVALFAAKTLPPGWLACDGQGNGAPPVAATASSMESPTAPFIPDLCGRFWLGAGGDYRLGQAGGEAMHTLSTPEIPRHYHAIQACGGPPDSATPVDAFPAMYAGDAGSLYGGKIDTSLGVSNPAGQGLAHENMPPFLVVTAGLASSSVVPDEPFLGEIRLLTTADAPKEWELCVGQTKLMSQYPSLYALLGTRFGGDGRMTFGLPDLRGRVAQGQGPGVFLGTMGGEATVTLVTVQMPTHAHSRTVSTATTGSQDAPAPDVYVTQTGGRGGFLQLYATPEQQLATPVAMLPSHANGGGEPHNNMAPYFALNAYICLAGLFPPHLGDS